MRYDAGSRDRRRIVWGTLLIGIGIVLLLGQLGAAGVIPVAHWWPGILFAVGVVQMLFPERPRQFASGLTLILLSLWFFACIEHWYGLYYHNAWPLLLVIFGGEMVLIAALERSLARRRESEEPHV
jgi:hypothetical protein